MDADGRGASTWPSSAWRRAAARSRRFIGVWARRMRNTSRASSTCSAPHAAGNNGSIRSSPRNSKRTDPAHPILTGIGDMKVYDEFYYALDRAPGIHPLLTAKIDGNDEMAAWSWERPDGGRAFGFVGLHFHSNWQLPEYRRLVVQGVLWSLKPPVPAGGVNVDIDSRKLELNGALPPPAAPGSEKKAKKPLDARSAKSAR